MSSRPGVGPVAGVIPWDRRHRHLLPPSNAPHVERRTEGASTALTERSRSALYQGLTTVIDEEAVQEMLSYFPARDVEEPVTKEFLRAEVADLRTELRDEMAELRTELRSEMSDLRTEMAAMELRMNDRMDERFRSMYGLTIGTNVVTVIAVAMVIFAPLRL